MKRAAGEVVQWAWASAVELGAIGPRQSSRPALRRVRRRQRDLLPAGRTDRERCIHIGSGTMIGPHVTLSAGMVPGQVPVTDPVVRIGDRCLIGKGSGIVGHLSIEIGDDVWTGHHVYITDQNHGYEDLSVPISRQASRSGRCAIGAGSWLGHGTVVLPGARIGRHVAVAAGSVVSGDLPAYCVAAGAPAWPIREWDGTGWPRSSDV